MSQTLENEGIAREAKVIAPAEPGRGRLLAAVGIFGALIASSCCVVPLVLVTLGVSGAWIGNLTALEPYKPYFLTVTAFLLAGGFWHVYFKPKKVCAEGTYCAQPASNLLTKSVLWIATLLVLLSATVNFWAPFFY
ncbi:MAG: mercury transporter MerT [Gammaproteobacteria bacterium]|nr:mercury transporter MerT [Gammaproteobacteria bacterium]